MTFEEFDKQFKELATEARKSGIILDMVSLHWLVSGTLIEVEYDIRRNTYND